jgi:hypothetical protein
MKTLLYSTLLALSVIPAAGQRPQSFEIDRNSASNIEITSVFNVVPPTGYAPVRVRVTNNTDGEMSIPVSTESTSNSTSGRDHSLRSNFKVSAPARKTTERELLVPLCPAATAGGGSGGERLTVTVSTSGGSFVAGFDPGGSAEMPFAAYSHGLARRSITDINSTVTGWSSGSRYYNQQFAALYDATQLPSDWRGLAGVDVLSLTLEEWTALSPAAVTAVTQWVKLGGTLDLYARAGASLPGQFGVNLRAPQSDNYFPSVVGAGAVRVMNWNGKELERDAARVVVNATTITKRRMESARQFKSEQGAFYMALGKKDFAAGQVGLILLIFGIIVGPVNLFVFARQGRRHRLFYTTPIISAAAALLLLLVIYFQDGTGGEGHRASIVYLDPRDHTAYIHQQQISRTGVLFSSGFTTESPVHVTQAVMPPTRWTRFKGEVEPNSFGHYTGRNEDRGEPQGFTVSDSTYAGDWFQSRAEQAQIIEAVQPTRGRLELKAGSNPPVIISSLPAALESLYFVDGSGAVWKAPGSVGTGAEVVMNKWEPADDFKDWITDQLQYCPGNYAETLTDSGVPGFKEGPLRGHFYALSSDAAAGMVNTNESIEWKSNTVFLFGPLN